MRTASFHPDALIELTDAASYYESNAVGLGVELLSEIERAIEQITGSPEACQVIGRKVRRKSLWRFPYSIFYAVTSDRLRIVACAHQKRRPFYWRKRLK